MKAHGLFIFILPVFLFFSCTSPRDKAAEKIADFEKTIYGDTTGMLDKVKLAELNELYISFASTYPVDEKSPDYLYSAATISMNFMDSHKAIELFNRIMDEYPNYEKKAECLFMTGFIYDNNLQDYDKAKDVYEEFLEKYPDDVFADDARASIDNLGKSLEEIIEEFERRNQAVTDNI